MNDFPTTLTLQQVNSLSSTTAIRWMNSPSAQLQQWTGSTKWHSSGEWFPNQSDTATSEQPQLNNSHQMNDFSIHTLLHQHSPATFLLRTLSTLFLSRLARSVGWADIEVKFHPVWLFTRGMMSSTPTFCCPTYVAYAPVAGISSWDHNMLLYLRVCVCCTHQLQTVKQTHSSGGVLVRVTAQGPL